MTREETIKALREALDSVDVTFTYRLALVNAIEHLSISEPQRLDKPRDCGKGIHKQEYTGCDMSWMDESQRLDEAAIRFAQRAYSPFEDAYEVSRTFQNDVACFKAGAKWIIQKWKNTFNFEKRLK